MRILFIRYKKSSGIAEGGELCSRRNYEALCSIAGADNVSVRYMHDEAAGHSAKDYLLGALLLPLGYSFGLTPSKLRAICREAGQYDIVFIDRSIFGKVAKELKAKAGNVHIVTFFHNVEKVYWRSKLGGRIGARVMERCASRNDRWACRWSDSIIALNRRDSALLESLYGRAASAIIPITLPDNGRREPVQGITSPRPRLAFIGSCFTPNVQGIRWFIENVYPKVDASLKIVGKGMEKIALESWMPADVEVVGNAPSLQLHFDWADIVILPIFKGSGMKVKTCEALMQGKNIIGSSEAFEGYEIEPDRAGGLCNTADEFIGRIKDFASAPRPRFNAYCREVYLERYSDASSRAAFAALLKGK